MSPATIIILLILAALVALSVRSYVKKLRGGGCCGGGDCVRSIPPGDRDARHYPVHRVARVDGMVCQSCARRVENAFNVQDGMMAKVDMEKKTVDVYAKTPLTDDMIRRTVHDAGYAALDVREAQAP